MIRRDFLKLGFAALAGANILKAKEIEQAYDDAQWARASADPNDRNSPLLWMRTVAVHGGTEQNAVIKPPFRNWRLASAVCNRDDMTDFKTGQRSLHARQSRLKVSVEQGAGILLSWSLHGGSGFMWMPSTDHMPVIDGTAAFRLWAERDTLCTLNAWCFPI